MRPEEHIWLNHARRYYPGPDAELVEVRPADDMYDPNFNNQLRCRKCHEKTAYYSEDMPPRSKSAVIEKLQKHEDFCVAKRKKPSKSKASVKA